MAETNQGGEMVEHTIRMVDRNVSYRSVHASRGKIIRTEPISALYEQGRCHHTGCFARLEDRWRNGSLGMTVRTVWTLLCGGSQT